MALGYLSLYKKVSMSNNLLSSLYFFQVIVLMIFFFKYICDLSAQEKSLMSPPPFSFLAFCVECSWT